MSWLILFCVIFYGDASLIADNGTPASVETLHTGACRSGQRHWCKGAAVLFLAGKLDDVGVIS